MKHDRIEEQKELIERVKQMRIEDDPCDCEQGEVQDCIMNTRDDCMYCIDFLGCQECSLEFEHMILSVVFIIVLMVNVILLILILQEVVLLMRMIVEVTAQGK